MIENQLQKLLSSAVSAVLTSVVLCAVLLPGVPVPRRVKIGAEVQAANCLSCPPPRYPVLARQQRIQGVVRLHALINQDGTVGDLVVVGTPPLVLAQASIPTVRQWRYHPTLLNGEPVEVDTIIVIDFSLR